MANNSSEYMKDCFADAVIQLLNDYPLKDIPIKQICNLAGYHSASWFRAFRSKSEAVTYHMVRLWQQYCDKHDIAVRDDWSIDNAEAFFQYNYEVRDTTRLLYRRGLMPELKTASSPPSSPTSPAAARKSASPPTATTSTPSTSPPSPKPPTC